MEKSGFSESQIISILNKQEQGLKVRDICREHGRPSTTGKPSMVGSASASWHESKNLKQQLFQPEGPNQVWSLDFMHDSLWDGRTFRMLNVIGQVL